ncbi:MAG TPA: sialidase family protein [Candidatus Sulfotelmatobacter sp.]|nr:sialidase family protein [Candidatus Sulfotelmatobacter sp.]
MVEPTLAIDPANPKHWVVAVIVSSPDLSSSDCATLVTLDAGRTWKRYDLHVTECFDPWLGFVGKDEIWLGVLEKASSLRLFRSLDGGENWVRVPTAAEGVDHETFVSGQSHHANDREVYIVAEQDTREPVSGIDASSIMIMRSVTSVPSFQTINVIPALVSLNAMNPVVLEDGTLLVPYADFGMASSDGDKPLQHPRSWLLRSRNQGKTFAPPTLISEACYRSWEWISLDSATQSPFRGRLYYACTGIDYHSILLNHSTDGGRTWLGPVSVFESSASQQQRTPMIAVNRNGIVGMSWFEDRIKSDNSSKATHCVELLFSVSVDGGTSFLTPVTVTGVPSCSSSVKKAKAEERWPTGGDYTGLQATPDGVFHLVWSDARNGTADLWTAEVKQAK